MAIPYMKVAEEYLTYCVQYKIVINDMAMTPCCVDLWELLMW